MDGERFLRINGSGGGDFSGTGAVGSSSPSRSVSSPPPEAIGVGVNGGASYILHTVSKFDTLAGIAIKYGVEVADIKRLNGLVTDLQMFALKTLQIPLPGRHPPSPVSLNGHTIPPRPNSSQQTLSNRRHSELFGSFPLLKLNSSSQQKVSPAMSSLQSYYGLRPADCKGASEGFEMAVYWKGGAHSLEDVEPLVKASCVTDPLLGQPKKSKCTASLLGPEIGNPINQVSSQESENCNSEKMVRRRQKSGADFTQHNPEKLLKEDNTSSSVISAITGKGLALRPKSANRGVPDGVDSNAAGPNPIPIGLGDSVLTDTTSSVRKSSSTSSLQDPDNGALLPIWPVSKWSLKPDFQALSSVAITRPILDGLSKPTSRRNKAAVD